MSQTTVGGLLQRNKPKIDAREPITCDTEVTSVGIPYCLTFSNKPGTGWLIMADDKEALSWFQAIVDNHNAPIVFHNYLFDQRVVTAMGLRFPWDKIVDTMAISFHLGNLPQGLKALAYRELGMKMMDFDDLVTPYSTPLAIRYLTEAYLSYDWPRPEQQLKRQEDGSWKLYSPQSMTTMLKRFLTEYEKNPSKSPFEAWDNWEDRHQEIEEKMGPFPHKCITHAPFEKVLHYACRDSDATLRLYYRLIEMRGRVRKTLQENWSD